jgi:hypothetical protein
METQTSIFKCQLAFKSKRKSLAHDYEQLTHPSSTNLSHQDLLPSTWFVLSQLFCPAPDNSDLS